MSHEEYRSRREMMREMEALRRELAHQQLQERRLADAVLADHRDAIAGVEGEGQVVEDPALAARVVNGMRERRVLISC